MNSCKNVIQLVGTIRFVALVWAASAILCRSAHCQDPETGVGKKINTELTRSPERETMQRNDPMIFYGRKVISETRTLKDIRDITTNIFVIGAEEIEKHHWHFLSDILRHYGLFIFSTQDFGATSIINIQGMENLHILILLDGIAWRAISSGDAETAGIPVDIIDRIEIVKGPASHAYGSALAGVVNIITKTGKEAGEGLAGSASATYGERSILDSWARIAGKIWKTQYFIHIGHQDSGIMEYERSFENKSAYGKIALPLSEDIKATLTAMHSAPYLGLGAYESQNFGFSLNQSAWFVKADWEASIRKNIRIEFDLYHMDYKNVMMTDLLQYETSAFYSDDTVSEKRMGGNGKIILKNGAHTLVAGVETERGDIENSQIAGLLLQSYGISGKTETQANSDIWGVFLNDTIDKTSWSITAGIRYDDNNYSGSQLSHSLGLSWKGTKKTICRVNYSKGFAAPPTMRTSTGWLFLDPNSELVNEEVTSYQAGFEAIVLNNNTWIKGTCFYHDLENAFFRQLYATETGNDLYINQGDIRRRGFEIQAETAPIHGFTVRTGLSYTYTNDSNEDENARTWIFNSELAYENSDLFSARLLGNYVRTDLNSGNNPEYNTIFDLIINKNVEITESRADIYVGIHNMFNASQYTYDFRKNAGRWMEFGVKYHL